MNFFVFLLSRWDEMLSQGLGHATVVGLAVLFATIVGVSIGILTYRNERAKELALAASGAILTIPSFALFILLLGPLGLGYKPVLLALTMYGLMPIIRNTVAGLAGVDPAIVEAARGMGMTRRQQLLKIELPLAWPVILTGIRVTALTLLAIAATGAIVNGPGYGDFIFRGLARVGTPVAVNMVLAGTLGVAVLAIIFDAVFHGLRRVTTSKGIR